MLSPFIQRQIPGSFAGPKAILCMHTQKKHSSLSCSLVVYEKRAAPLKSDGINVYFRILSSDVPAFAFYYCLEIFGKVKNFS